MNENKSSASGDPGLGVAGLVRWRLTHEGTRIRRDWVMADFNVAMAFLQEVAGVAEREGHHPDLHLEGYRNVWIEIFTHSTGGITARDISLAQRIDTLEHQ